MPGTQRGRGGPVTLNIGWISGDSAFLVSDTSATSRRDPRHPLTSLGQPQGRSDGLAVEEIAAKVVPFGTHAAAALCGDARGGTAFVRDVLRRLSVGVSLDQALLSAGHSLRHQKPAFGAFVVTVARWDDGPKILQYRSDSLELVDVSSVGVVVEGSLRAPLVDAVRERILGLPGPAIHAQVVL